MATNSPLLVRTPHQFLGESPLGFVLRASEMNGYETPRHLFSMAKATRDQMFSIGLEMNKIAEVLGRNPDSLRGYRESGETDISRVNLCGHPLVTKDLDLAMPKICPECVQECGFIPAWTDLGLVDACPNHGRMLITGCPGCGNRLSWFRPGVLRCGCGANLADARGAPIGAEHAALLSQVVARVVGVVAANPCAMPVEQFQRMTLHGLLAIIEGLVQFDRAAQTELSLSMAASGGLLLSNWPENLFAVFRKLFPSDAVDRNGIIVLRQHFERIYRTIRNKITAAEDIRFLREIISDYSRTLKEGDGRSVGSLPVSSQIASSGLEKANNEDENSLPYCTPKKKRIAFKRRLSVAPIGERSIPIRDAAKQVGLPVSVLRSLRRSGHFEARHKASRALTFHEADILAFANKVSAIPIPQHVTGVAVLSLERALNLKFKFNDGKGKLVAAVFDGRLSVLGSLKPGLLGLLLDMGEIQQFIAELRASAFGGGVTPSEVAKMLHCDPLVVPALLASGYLEGRRFDAGLRITRESVNSFGATFRSVAGVAKGLHTSSRRLIRDFQAAGIDMLTFERGYGKNPQPFVRITDCDNFV